MSLENTWQEIRDHSFIQNHSRSFRFTASSLQFTDSSSTGCRSENTWREIRDHSFIQNHSRSFRFTASSLQFTHSSSTGCRSENTWREIRDHSFIQNHSRSFIFPAPWRCFISSVHLTHVLQGSGLRTGMAIAEAWFCAQWTIFVLFLRFVFGLLSGWKIQTWPILRFLTESVTYWFLSVGIW